MKTNMVNNLNKGSVRTIVFKDGDTWYGVGLEFNIVVDADTAELAAFELNEAIKGYVTSIVKSQQRVGGLRVESMLNQTAEPEYEEMWNSLVANEPLKSPYQVSSFGRQLILN
jgi:hypothetical protein